MQDELANAALCPGIVEETKPLPAGFLCPVCGYDLSGSTQSRCSECAYQWSISDLARASCVAACARLTRVQALVILLLGILAGALQYLVSGRWLGAIVSSATVAGSLVISLGGGLLLARAAPVWERSGWRAAWLRSHLWLNLLTPCVLAFLTLRTMMDTPRYGLNYVGFPMVVCGGILVPLIGWTVFAFRWAHFRVLYELKDRTAIVYFPLLAFGVGMAAVFVVGAVV